MALNAQMAEGSIAADPSIIAMELQRLCQDLGVQWPMPVSSQPTIADAEVFERAINEVTDIPVAESIQEEKGETADVAEQQSFPTIVLEVFESGEHEDVDMEAEAADYQAHEQDSNIEM